MAAILDFFQMAPYLILFTYANSIIPESFTLVAKMAHFFHQTAAVVEPWVG